MTAESPKATSIPELIAETRQLVEDSREVREPTWILIDQRYRLLREMAKLKVEFRKTLNKAYRADEAPVVSPSF